LEYSGSAWEQAPPGVPELLVDDDVLVAPELLVDDDVLVAPELLVDDDALVAPELLVDDDVLVAPELLVDDDVLVAPPPVLLVLPPLPLPREAVSGAEPAQPPRVRASANEHSMAVRGAMPCRNAGTAPL
jgi:hypothetical protein